MDETAAIIWKATKRKVTKDFDVISIGVCPTCKRRMALYEFLGSYSTSRLDEDGWMHGTDHDAFGVSLEPGFERTPDGWRRTASAGRLYGLRGRAHRKLDDDREFLHAYPVPQHRLVKRPRIEPAHWDDTVICPGRPGKPCGERVRLVPPPG
jgi:hypothetical protein